MVNTIIFPSSYFRVNKVDEDLQEEYNAAINTGLFNVIIFGYDKWFNQGKLILTEYPAQKIKAIYRGWMMKPESYMHFYDDLLANNIELITSPEEYQAMHVFPNVYELVKENTAKMKIYSLHEELPCEELKSEFSRFMIKDYVKSVKGTEFPRYFDKSITQDALNEWMEVFYKYRGDLLTGGICVKEYLDLKLCDNNTNEYRVFYINHEIATVSRNSDQVDITNTPPVELVEQYKKLPSCYYTIDFAELSDGTWTIIEAGDGSVSGLAEEQDYENYYRVLYNCVNK